MLDRVSTFTSALASAFLDPGGPAPCAERPRARHAIMLDYAGRRRRAAQKGLDGPYWKALHPAALERARDLRRAGGFHPLP